MTPSDTFADASRPPNGVLMHRIAEAGNASS
jgi:hypothetical protein